MVSLGRICWAVSAFIKPGGGWFFACFTGGFGAQSSYTAVMLAKSNYELLFKQATKTYAG